MWFDPTLCTSCAKEVVMVSPLCTFTRHHSGVKPLVSCPSVPLLQGVHCLHPIAKLRADFWYFCIV